LEPTRFFLLSGDGFGFDRDGSIGSIVIMSHTPHDLHFKKNAPQEIPWRNNTIIKTATGGSAPWLLAKLF